MNWKAIDLTRKLDDESLHYSVQFQPDEAQALALALPHKYVAPETLAALFLQIDKAFPPMDYGKLNGEENPNNGKPHHTYRIGREYSRVVYVDIAKAYLKGDYSIPQMSAKIKRAATRAHADEFSIEQDFSSITYRMWWD